MWWTPALFTLLRWGLPDWLPIAVIAAGTLLSRPLWWPAAKLGARREPRLSLKKRVLFFGAGWLSSFARPPQPPVCALCEVAFFRTAGEKKKKKEMAPREVFLKYRRTLVVVFAPSLSTDCGRVRRQVLNGALMLRPCLIIGVSSLKHI